MIVTVRDLRTVSEANTRTHWAARARRMRLQRDSVTIALRPLKLPSLPVVVTLTRIAPRRMDSDNLAGSLKGVRDAVADALMPDRGGGNQHQRWADDSDDRIEWEYGQRQGKPGQYAVEIEIRPGGRL